MQDTKENGGIEIQPYSFFTILLLYFPAPILPGKEIPVSTEKEADMLKLFCS
jgi:hypothetical protein